MIVPLTLWKYDSTSHVTGLGAGSRSDLTFVYDRTEFEYRLGLGLGLKMLSQPSSMRHDGRQQFTAKSEKSSHYISHHHGSSSKLHQMKVHSEEFFSVITEYSVFDVNCFTYALLRINMRSYELSSFTVPRNGSMCTRIVGGKIK